MQPNFQSSGATEVPGFAGSIQPKPLFQDPFVDMPHMLPDLHEHLDNKLQPMDFPLSQTDDLEMQDSGDLAGQPTGKLHFWMCFSFLTRALAHPSARQSQETSAHAINKPCDVRHNLQ